MRIASASTCTTSATGRSGWTCNCSGRPCRPCCVRGEPTDPGLDPSEESMKVMVTGGAGFIGSHVVDGYVEQGWDVVVVDDLSTGHRSNLNPKAAFYEVDIRSPRLWEVFEKERPQLLNHHAAQMSVRHSVAAPLSAAQG